MKANRPSSPRERQAAQFQPPKFAELNKRPLLMPRIWAFPLAPRAAGQHSQEAGLLRLHQFRARKLRDALELRTHGAAPSPPHSGWPGICLRVGDDSRANGTVLAARFAV